MIREVKYHQHRVGGLLIMTVLRGVVYKMKRRSRTKDGSLRNPIQKLEYRRFRVLNIDIERMV